MRQVIAFPCAGEALIGSLDPAGGEIGILIVSGGNEVRMGAHRGMAMLAARLAAAGIPAFRYDRRGVGDSAGANRGFRGGEDDLIAAAAAFRQSAPHLVRIVGFGNCDGAATLALFGRAAGIERIVLANPWLTDEADALPAAAAIRDRYRRRLLDQAAWRQLLRGGIDWRSLASGLRKIARRDVGDPTILRAIAGWRDDATVMLAGRDATAIAYADAASRAGLTLATVTIDSASHSFAAPGDADALAAALIAAAQR